VKLDLEEMGKITGRGYYMHGSYVHNNKYV